MEKLAKTKVEDCNQGMINILMELDHLGMIWVQGFWNLLCHQASFILFATVRHNQKRAKALCSLEGQTHLGARKESLRNFLNWSHMNSFSKIPSCKPQLFCLHTTQSGHKSSFPSKEHDNKYQPGCLQVFFLTSIVTHPKNQNSSIPTPIKWLHQTLLQQQNSTYHPITQMGASCLRSTR